MVSQTGEDAPLFSAKVFFSGLSFVLFGAGGLLLSVTAFPLFYLLPLGAQRRKRWSRGTISALFPIYIRFMEICGLISLSTRGCENLGHNGQLIIANHPSLLDTVYMISIVRNATCVVKPALFQNPFTALAVRAAGYISSESPTLLDECASSLAAGESVIIFPEGTRTDPQQPFRFYRGAANIALSAGCDISPVVIRCHPARLMKHQPWYKMANERLSVIIERFPNISHTTYSALNLPRAVISRRITRDLESFYTNQ